MTTLRIFIDNEDLNEVNWQSIDNMVVADSGRSSLNDLMQIQFEYAEIYLAPYMTTIIKAELGAISDKKINDELLLGLVEDSLAEDIENCKPILMRLTDGVDYVAVLNRYFYEELLDKLSNNIKQIKFIQPFAYLTNYVDESWTLYMVGSNKFIRTSLYEYFLLDDKEPMPEILEYMLSTYANDSIIVYTDNDYLIEELANKYKLNCKRESELNYGVLNWNLYNAKSKRFDIKLTKETNIELNKLVKVLGSYAAIFIVFWILNLFFMIYEKHKLQNQIAADLSGISSSTSFGPNLLSQVDEKLSQMEHDKGIYAPDDMVRLFDVFLKSMPDVDNTMIQGIQYSGSQLNIFLSANFNPSQFSNDQGILLTRRIKADITDYKSYKAAQSSSNSQNNNGGGVLSNTDLNNTSSNSALQDSAWVITLQLISRMDNFNDSNSGAK